MSLAKSYAKALYEASNAGEREEIKTQLANVAELVASSKEARAALYSPATSSKEKAGVLQAIGQKAAYPKLLVNFLLLLARKGRLSFLTEISDSFEAVCLEAEGGVLGRLTSAEPIEKSDVDSLAAAFSKRLGRKVAFSVSTDPALLAGMRVTVAGVSYDGTLRSQLDRLREKFMSGAGAARA